MPSNTLECLKMKRLIILSVGEDMRRQKYKMVLLLWSTVWQLLKKLNTRLDYDPPILLLGTYPREMKACLHIKPCTRMVTKASLVIAQCCK